MGGAQGIGSALKVAAKIGKDNKKYGKLWIGVHVGWHAGQNLYHPHYHVIEPLSALDVKGNAEESPGLDVTETAVMKSETMAVHCAGCITGQCWISVDTQELRDYIEAWGFMEGSCRHNGTHELAETLANLIALYNDRFKSTQGLPPDFNLWLEIENGYLLGGTYTPILNQIGFDGYAAIQRNTPFVLAWSHADTARHLLGKE